MRASLVALVALMACSDSSGPHHIPVLTTQLSSSTAGVGGTLTATLIASNPTDTTLQLSFSPIGAEIKVSGQWQAGTSAFGDGFGGAFSDTAMSLAPGATASLGSVSMTFEPAASSTTPENFTLKPGQYSIRACYYPSPPFTPPAGTVTTIQCGNTLTLTLTQ